VVLRDGRPVLIDLGLARPLGEPPAGGHRRGSPPWMAPEQVRRRPASPAMDLFALGAVLYELATGAQAFEPADHGPPERRWPQLHGPPPRARRRNPEVPAALDRAVATLLAPAPDDRPATAGQALALLAEAMPADAGEEDRLWPIWATGRLGDWQASTMTRPPLASRPA
jgi:serine/threonine protein kinase